MLLNGDNYRYDVVRITKDGKFTKLYALVDNNTNLTLAYGNKGEVTVAAKLLCLGGTIALASALSLERNVNL